MTRKERSEAFLRHNGIKINPNLPERTPGTLRTQDEIMRRSVTAFLAAQIAIDLVNDRGGRESAEFFAKLLNRFSLADALTPDEQRLFVLAEGADENLIPAAFANAMAWRTEMCMPLFRACGILRDGMAYPDRPSDLTPAVQRIRLCDNLGALRSICTPADPEQILDGADLIYRMDWACVDARLKKEQIPGGLNYDVIVEQHKGFLWMIGAYDAENWDTVKPHT